MQDIACVVITLFVSVTIMSKGSIPRPFNVTNEEYANRWAAIFGKDNEKKNEAQTLESDRSDPTRNRGCINNPQGEVGQTPLNGILSPRSND